jgi:hypothetical protein
MTVGLRLPLPAGCEMAGLAPTAERALKLLGAMTLALHAQGLQVSPVARYRGLEALLLSAHLCPPLRDPRRVHAAFDALKRTAHLMARALAEPEDRILVALRHAAGVRGLLVAAPDRGAVAAVPSFDPETAARPGRRRARR